RGEAGALLRWDPILAAGVRMTVKVVDEFDAPLRGWYAHVGATIDGQWESRWGPTAADGRFVAENCADGAYMVDVTEPGARFPAFRIMGVRPSVDEMVLRMTRAMRATAVITGRIVDPDGNGIEGAEVGVRREGDPVVVTVRTTADDGRYRIERIPAGSYFVEARARGRPANRSGPHVVAADVTCDAGSLRLAAPGWLVIRLRRDAGLPVGRPEICCQNVAGGRFEWLDVDEHGVARSSPLVAGAYRLWIYGLDVVTRSQDLEIKAGERTTLDVGFASGVQLRLRFTDSPVSRDLRQLRFRAIDPAGAVVDEVVLDREPPKPFEWWCGLRLGPWVIEARTLDGALRASARVTVRGIEDAGRIVPIALN
ncbi:MAG: carboxypeptidase regulatory-like domain-containing protein, partial [Planctomycetes bacterium]|nr:carboxypeptidase regulatory-like domain-containing protein [Planctomycetota bacterium]